MSNEISIVIPMYNERDNVQSVYDQVVSAMERAHQPFEMIIIDDGSTDGTDIELVKCTENDRRIKLINFRHNHGQTAALMAGFDHARNDIIIAMDGDLQNDPNDIPLLLAKLDEGYDVVSGWRQNRQDDAIRRNLLSRIANKFISRISGVHLHDYGCTLKAYRKSVLSGIRLYGEMHRFIPIYAKWSGAKVCEVPVNHHPRRFGKSKYGLIRIFKVTLDIFLVKFLLDYNTRPLHVFGAFGFICFGISLLSGIFALYLRFFENISFIQTPLPLLVVMTFITGVLCILLGLLAELLVRVYYESQSKPSYTVKDISAKHGD